MTPRESDTTYRLPAGSGSRTVLARLRTAYLSALLLIAALSLMRLINTHTALARLSVTADSHTLAQLRSLGWTDFVMASVILAALIAEGLLVFRPAVKMIRKQLALLETARDAAAQAADARTRFLAHMSHEIRTPLTAIIGYAQMASEPGTDDAMRAEALRAVSQNSAHLMGVINDVLDLARIDAEGVSIRRERIPLVRVIDDTMLLFREHAAAKGLALSHEIASPVPHDIETDPVRLRQILVNLIGNAIKFTPSGSVTLRIGAGPSDSGGHTVRIEITDTGIGMTEQQLGRLFNPFIQADDTTHRRFGGTGLGLVIARKFARALGGDISVTSRAGEGTTVVLETDPGDLTGARWCATPAELRSATPTPHGAGAPSTRLTGRVLVVDDFPDNLRLIALRLRKAGAEVTAVETGRSAIDAAVMARNAGTPFDLILMDMQMPEMDGPEATRALRERGILTPVIALTANTMEAHRAAFREAGADDFLSKPFETTRLLETCRAWIERTPQRDRSRRAA